MQDFAANAAAFALPDWEALPDLGLYMDQVITYIQRQYRPLYGEGRRIVTAAMINNYVKSGLVTRPEKKKYGREQLAQLLVICGLKQALPLEAMGRLLAGAAPETTYGAFRAQAQAAAAQLADRARGEALTPMACAVQGAGLQLLCGALLSATPAPAENVKIQKQSANR